MKKTRTTKKRIQGLNEYMLSDTDKKLLMLSISVIIIPIIKLLH